MNTKQRVRSMISGSVGNLIEWYDWYVYSAFAIYFAHVFFPKSSATVQLMHSAGIFAIGFLMRPLGGWLFGNLADLKGRKYAIIMAILLMAIGSLMIAITPGYATIGVWAPIMLLVARLLQGLSIGGGYGTSATYLSELSGTGKRGFYTSFQYVTMVGGQILALCLQWGMQHRFSDQQMSDWGWRVPFFVGFILSLMALQVCHGMEETDAFKKQQKITKKPSKQKKGQLRLLLEHPKAFFTAIGITMGGTMAFYTNTTYLQKFLVNTAHWSVGNATTLMLIALTLFAAIQPLVGAWSDKVGRKPLLIGFGVLGVALTVPIFKGLSVCTNTYQTFGLVMALLLMVSGYTAINSAVKAELFPVHIRALGVSLPHSLAVSIFGGFSEYLALLFKSMGHETWYYWLVTGCIFISLLVYCGMKETYKEVL
jgi:MFS transporter, MHS family, alpha-ketoglutarate permease